MQFSDQVMHDIQTIKNIKGVVYAPQEEDLTFHLSDKSYIFRGVSAEITRILFKLLEENPTVQEMWTLLVELSISYNYRVQIFDLEEKLNKLLA